MKTLTLILILSLLAGCVPKERNEKDVREGMSSSLKAYEDTARGVVCYRLSAIDSISCVKVDKRKGE